MATPEPDRRPGEDWSLRALYDLVPDAYELDLLEESRRPPVTPVVPDFAAAHDAFVASLGFDDAPDAEDPGAPSVTQAQFLVERLLGGEVVDDPAR